MRYIIHADGNITKILTVHASDPDAAALAQLRAGEAVLRVASDTEDNLDTTRYAVDLSGTSPELIAIGDAPFLDYILEPVDDPAD